MDMNEYQRLSAGTAVYPGKGTWVGMVYAALGLGEAGELQGKVKKILRDDNFELTVERRDAIAAELGDVLWYVAAMATELQMPLGDIASANANKLADRASRGVIGGSGDYR